MPDPLALSVIDLEAELRAKRISAVELMELVLSRVDATRTTLNAVVATFPREDLIAAARAADERIARGEARPFEGLPLGVKDLEDLAGLPNTLGSAVFKDSVPDRDTIQVRRLRAAGAIPIGKTNAPEFGFTAITKNLVYGVTRNPWDLERSPGGSSGGSSAALSGGVLPLVTASDGGGSIRIPASFVGAFGLKVGQGRVPMGPDAGWVLGDTAVSGPLTRTVADAALFLDQVAGYSREDPLSLPDPGLSYLEAVRTGLDRKLRIAFSPALGYANVQTEIGDAVYDSVKVFEELGHQVDEIAGGPDFLIADWGLMGGFELAAKLHPYLPEREGEFGRAFLAGVKSGWRFTPEVYERMAHSRRRLWDWVAGLFDNYDLIVTPTIPHDPPPAAGPFPTETNDKPQVNGAVAAFTVPFNLTGHPAGTVRVGLSNAGLPMGMQIVGDRYREDLVLQACAAFEQERPWAGRWPAIGEGA